MPQNWFDQNKPKDDWFASNAPSSTESTVSATQAAKPPSWMDLRYPGVPSPNDLIGVAQGAGREGVKFVEGGANWLRNIAGLPSEPPRMDAKGRYLSETKGTAEKVGSIGGKVAIGAMTGGPTSLGGKVAAGGILGAMQGEDSTSTNIGAGVGMAAPILAKAIPPIVSILKGTNTAPSVAKFEQVMGAARNELPDSLVAGDDAAIRAMELAGKGAKSPGRGSTMPKVLSDYIKNREQNIPITYEVARDFAKNAGRLSASEKMATSGEMEAVLAQFAKAMDAAASNAASKKGMDKVLAEAMKGFASAKTQQELVQALISGAKRVAPYAIGGAVGGRILRQFMK